LGVGMRMVPSASVAAAWMAWTLKQLLIAILPARA